MRRIQNTIHVTGPTARIDKDPPIASCASSGGIAFRNGSSRSLALPTGAPSPLSRPKMSSWELALPWLLLACGRVVFQFPRD